MCDLSYIYFTVAILAQAVNLQSIVIILLVKHQLQHMSIMQTRTLVFMSFSGDVLMTLEDVNKEDKWSSILEMITTEGWYQTCKRWKFVFGVKKLEPDDVLDSVEDQINITCTKIDPQIIFKLSSGEFLVSISFESCKVESDRFNERVNVILACFEANRKLRELGKDGYGRVKTKIHPLMDPCYKKFDMLYVFHDENGKKLDYHNPIEDPGDDNVLIVANQKKIYCDICRTVYYGPLRIGEKRKSLREKISLCSICGFLHCPSCGKYLGYNVGTSDCHLSYFIPMDKYKHQEQFSSMIQTRTLIFVYLSGNVLMTLENVCEDVKWSSILEMIATEQWYQTCKRWRFIFGLKNLEPDDILNLDEDSNKIISIKIDPQVIFELSSGELLVSVSFDSCKSWRLPNDILYPGKVNVLCACLEANKKLRRLGKDGYGTDKTKICPLIDICYDICVYAPLYVFHDKNGKEMNKDDEIEDPGDNNVTFVAEPKELYCDICEIKFHGPLRIGEQRGCLREKIRVCSVCDFLHCPSCGRYMYYKVGTPECLAFHNM